MATPLTLAQLTTPLTRQEVQASIYSVLARLGVNTASWKSGAVVRTIVVGVSVVLAAFSTLMADVARSGFLEFSEGAWLVLVARHVYGVEKTMATFATGQVTLTNPGGGSFAFEPGDLIVANTVTGLTYRNTLAATLGALTTVTIDVVATEAGSGGNAAPHAITTITNTLIGGVTCDNALGMTAVDEESDAALRLRCQERLGALSPMGPWDAYAYAVRNATRADGQAIAVNRIRITKDGYGNVYVYVASADGLVTGGDLTIAADAVDQWATPQAVTAHVIAATPYALNVTAEVWAYNTGGLTNAQIEAAIVARMTLFCSAQPVGGNVLVPATGVGYVFADAVRAAVAAAVAPQTFHVTLTAPAADITLAVTDVTTVGTVTITVHQVAPPEGFAA
jgi:phage-related baseplate assembly protein